MRSSEQQFILETILAAGRIATQHFARLEEVDSKSAEIDLVTVADRETEEFLAAAIRSAFPGDAILAEESSILSAIGNGGAKLPERLWIVDPIDGTTNFVHTFPQFAISVAFWLGGEPRAAAVFNPATGELFAAERGEGATVDGRPIRVSTQSEVGRMLASTGFAYDRRERVDYYLEIVRAILMNTHGVRRLGSAALDLCWVAAGRLDAHVETNLAPWDVAAGRLILEEAGGKLTDFSGGPLGLRVPEVVASNGAGHGDLVALFRPLAGGKIPPR
jgi:myo-inositol-1(or 4)-monophosphatase